MKMSEPGLTLASMEIVNAVRTISLGPRYISPAVAELLAQQLNRMDGGSHQLKSGRGTSLTDVGESDYSIANSSP